jgi:hypothetical protein
VIFPQPHRQARHADQPVAFLLHPVFDSSTAKRLKRFQQSNDT